MLREISPTLQKAHGFTTTEAVTFRQLSANAAIYRDPVEFKNGVTIRLQELGESQSVEYSVGRCPLDEFRLEVTLIGLGRNGASMEALVLPNRRAVFHLTRFVDFNVAL